MGKTWSLHIHKYQLYQIFVPVLFVIEYERYNGNWHRESTNGISKSDGASSSLGVNTLYALLCM